MNRKGIKSVTEPAYLVHVGVRLPSRVSEQASRGPVQEELLQQKNRLKEPLVSNLTLMEVCTKRRAIE